MPYHHIGACMTWCLWKQSYFDPIWRISIAMCVWMWGEHVCVWVHKFGVATNHEKLRCDWAPIFFFIINKKLYWSIEKLVYKEYTRLTQINTLINKGNNRRDCLAGQNSLPFHEGSDKAQFQVHRMPLNIFKRHRCDWAPIFNGFHLA